MATDSAIEWTHDTANPWWGCTKKKTPEGRVRRACANCYAESLDTRLKREGRAHWGDEAPRLLQLETFEKQLRKSARLGLVEGRPRRVFIASMGDLFEDRPELYEARERAFELLHELEGQIIPLLLTKRPDVAAREAERLGWPPGAWLGASVEDQGAAEEMIPTALNVPGTAGVFLSMEPLVSGLVDLAFGHERDGFPGVLDSLGGSWVPAHGGPAHTELDAMEETNRVGWVIAGGESGRGPGIRPTHSQVIRNLRDDCAAAGVPFFFKQWGEWLPEGEATPVLAKGKASRVTTLGASEHYAETAYRVGKKQAGATLDGREHRALPAGWLP